MICARSIPTNTYTVSSRAFQWDPNRKPFITRKGVAGLVKMMSQSTKPALFIIWTKTSTISGSASISRMRHHVRANRFVQLELGIIKMTTLMKRKAEGQRCKHEQIEEDLRTDAQGSDKSVCHDITSRSVQRGDKAVLLHGIRSLFLARSCSRELFLSFRSGKYSVRTTIPNAHFQHYQRDNLPGFEGDHMVLVDRATPIEDPGDTSYLNSARGGKGIARGKGNVFSIWLKI
jgi:hypothetical protein